MKAARDNNHIVLCFGPEEAQFMRRVFASIIRQYQVKPEEVHPRVAEVLYSTRGCRSAGLNEEQTREWIENLHTLKMANLMALRRWRRRLTAKSDDVIELRLPDDEAQTLVTVLNDHRLISAARYNIGEDEMDIRTLTQIESLGARQRAALLDVMLLGGVIETVLALLPGGYGDWPMYANMG